MAKKKIESTEKAFGLKTIEVNLINTIQSLHQSQLANILSFIAIERLAYEVTENTRFRIEDGRLYIAEVPKTTEEVETA